jgi:hypothetical protein
LLEAAVRDYHRVLNHAAWSGRAAARMLLGLLLTAFVPVGVTLDSNNTVDVVPGRQQLSPFKAPHDERSSCPAMSMTLRPPRRVMLLLRPGKTPMPKGLGPPATYYGNRAVLAAYPHQPAW